ncbi:LuxR C-terminal-related transcriptional regulator [Streptomyces sp. NPDC046876]|uniref:helix-turn-helix transcriptional regulator n=1 Tax=Streptomyces sp. NPDC046876 TaxID=3155616 RepID=UPI0033C26727
MSHGSLEDTGRPASASAPHAREWALLGEQRRLCRTSARFVTLGGEPWIGKSHLLGRLASEALREGWTVARGRAPRGGRGRPFDVLVDALDDHLAAADGDLFERLGAEHVHHLARVFPALGGPALPQEREQHQEQHKHQEHAVFRAVRALLGLLAERTGVLLVLDDAHRAGQDVCDLLEHLVRHPPEGPVLTVVAHRSGPAAQRLAGLADGAAPLVRIVLRPLGEGAARGLLPAALNPLRRDLVLRDGAGVPGLLRALAQAETDRPGPSRGPYSELELATGVPPLLAAPPGVDLHTLTSLAWRTACAASVVGDPFAPGPVADTAGLPLADILRGVDELYGEGLLVPAEPAGRFVFARPAVRALVHHASGAGWRHAARERAVSALRKDLGSTAPALSALLEYAAPLSGSDLELLERAAREALFLQPARAVREARRVAAQPDAPPAAQLLLQRALVVAGRPAEAVAGYARLWPQLDRVPAEEAAQAVVWRARALRLLGQYTQARAVLEERAGGAAPGGPEWEAELAALLLEAAAAPAALAAARRAVAACPADRPALRGHALALLAAAGASGGPADGARAAADEAALLLGPPDDPAAAPHLEALRWLGAAEGALGSPARAREHLEQAFHIALRHGQGHLLGRLALELSHWCLETGDPVAAARHVEFAEAEFTRCGSRALLVSSNGLRNRIARSFEERERRTPTVRLSGREEEIAELVGPGLTNQQIADRLEISVKTVETYMARIFKKLGANSRAQVAHIVSGRRPGR